MRAHSHAPDRNNQWDLVLSMVSLMISEHCTDLYNIMLKPPLISNLFYF